jgi:AAA+ superfamily predicted ATPase
MAYIQRVNGPVGGGNGWNSFPSPLTSPSYISTIGQIISVTSSQSIPMPFFDPSNPLINMQSIYIEDNVPVILTKEGLRVSFKDTCTTYHPRFSDEAFGVFSDPDFSKHIFLAVGRSNIILVHDHINQLVAAHASGKVKSTPPKSKEITADSLSKVVLPAELKEEIIAVINQSSFKTKIFDDWGLGETIEYGRGQTMLFWGQPGTGKTFCARAIADAMSSPLMSVSTAELESSEPGAMERNVKEVFAEAKKNKAVLLLDECDSLVFSRENMGMILGAQINALLTEIEKYEGVLVLSTNRINKLDKALERRISLIVEFPFPTEPQRDLIWQKLMPAKLPLDTDVLTAELAKFEFTGGQIKNVLLGAARLAAHEGKDKVSKDHFFRAASRLAEGTTAFNRTTSSLNDHREAFNTSTQDDLGPAVDVGASRTMTKTRKTSTESTNK